MHTHVSIPFQILLPFRLLQTTEQSYLCYIVDPCWLSILNIVVCICQPFEITVIVYFWISTSRLGAP